MAQNSENAKHKIILVDMDGIKPYRIKRRSSRFRALAKLASTILWSGSVSRGDYLRTFKVYCNLTGLDVSRRKTVFSALAKKAFAIRLLTMAKTAIQEESEN